MANPSYLGVSPPLSNNPPSATDLKLSDALTAELKIQNNFATEEERKHKDAVIAALRNLCREMVQAVGKRKGLPESILEQAGGEVYTFGSHRLGVFSGSSDVDALMLAPKHVTREDFFDVMPGMLKQTYPVPDQMTEPNAVPGISVPIIKVIIQDVDIDLIFTNLPISQIPEKLDLSDTNLLRGIDRTDMRCLNGTRVTNKILQLVPHTKVFRLALRAIKLWSANRAIYGNVVGFPGGVAWAMMVARVCQLYPMAAAPLIVQKFFHIMKIWKWPQPVTLQQKEDVSLQIQPEWDPSTSRGDRAHLMPVLTPCYPIQNSTHTITSSTKKVILRELDRGHEIVNDIYAGKKEWKDLFQRHTFFTETYKHYICVITAARTSASLKSWEGFVLSKLKILAAGIEYSEGGTVELVQPFSKGFERTHLCPTQADVDKTIDGSLDCQVKETEVTEQTNGKKLEAENAEADGDANGTSDIKKEFPQTVNTKTFYLGIELKKGANSLDLSDPIQNFRDICLNWENIHLPDDVFQPGESRPVRQKKTKKKTTTGTPVGAATAPAKAPADDGTTVDKKRSFTDAGLDVCIDNATAGTTLSSPFPLPSSHAAADTTGVHATGNRVRRCS
nr:poly(a) polymerase pla1 [Quercus suber]